MTLGIGELYQLIQGGSHLHNSHIEHVLGLTTPIANIQSCI